MTDSGLESGAAHPVPAAHSLDTIAVHAGAPREEFGPVVAPISLSSTYRATVPGEYGPYDYARAGNPSRAALEEALTALEGGVGAGAFASGLAALDTALRVLRPGDRVVVSSDVYGGTWRLLTTVWSGIGVEVDPVDLTDPDRAAMAVRGAAMVIVETPSNPWLRVVDIERVCAAAHDTGALVLVDNTFATPWLQRPLELGADLVLHSTTKYLGGHSDVIGGALVAGTEALAERVHYLQKAAGAVASPFDCFLVLRGLRTLAVRMQRHCASAMRVAAWLASHPAVAQVHYPGLPTHPGHAVAARQMRQSGGMVSLQLAGGGAAAKRLAAGTELFTLAESLGAVESLIEVPALMTHLSTTGSLLEVPDDLVRLSVGIEDADDLIADLEQALAR